MTGYPDLCARSPVRLAPTTQTTRNGSSAAATSAEAFPHRPADTENYGHHAAGRVAAWHPRPTLKGTPQWRI